ncbi:MAG: 50S ribosomal protein L21 [Candidatus Abawacabacteria bacterium]|nr:50S ribosomal protein L21 [Candidatus Abawacabacteria bacterium]
MYAVIHVSGRQEQVMPGEVIEIEKLAGEVGDIVSFGNAITIVDGEKLDLAPKAEVKGKILEHGKGDKVLVFKKLRRKRYMRKKGHRQQYTAVEILAW